MAWAGVDAKWVAGQAEAAGLDLVDTAELPEREAQLAPIPAGLSPVVAAPLKDAYAEGLYSHQAEAIAASIAGKDVCLSTATASGKSLVFMTAAAHRLADDPKARILALYPAKALIKDQMDKWDTALAPLGERCGRIDGGVPVSERANLLAAHRVILMTPDVLHAWMMSRLTEPAIRSFLAHLELLVLDEAHVYEGVFGTHMAFLLRRFAVAAAPYSMICATATLGDPAGFCRRLTGRDFLSLGPDQDGSASQPKTILLADHGGAKPFDEKVDLVTRLAGGGSGRFLVFGDSRRMVEQLVSAVQRGRDADGSHLPVLPYRAGYEDEDREAIQSALGNGGLAGVVCTSALELGLDIGDIDLVVLSGVPPSGKAFWQRLGRAGRRNPGVCLILDDRSVLSRGPEGLPGYLKRSLEPSLLYLDNRYIQYTNALCAARELEALGVRLEEAAPFDSLPSRFRGFLINELDPHEPVPADLLPLKQIGLAGPHREFPIRCGIEKTYHVRGKFDAPLGTLTHGQMIREAYPGAVHYYMSRPYRVHVFNYKKGEIRVRPEKRVTTSPHIQANVFPHFATGTLALRRSAEAFAAESELQVRERVTGFVERRGSKKREHEYGPLSPYYQRPLTRFFETTGVCIGLPDGQAFSEAATEMLRRAFCDRFGIHASDLGVGRFKSNHGPFEAKTCRGVCVFDGVSGSLRLTQRLLSTLPEIVEEAKKLANREGEMRCESELADLLSVVSSLEEDTPERCGEISASEDGDWVLVIAEGEPAIYFNGSGPEDVKVLEVRYTPRGLVYDLEPKFEGSRWTVAAGSIGPLAGTTRMVRFNTVTGEISE